MPATTITGMTTVNLPSDSGWDPEQVLGTITSAISRAGGAEPTSVTIPIGVLPVATPTTLGITTQPLVTAFTASGTWTARTSTSMVLVFLFGGGGGGGAGFSTAPGASSSGGGGGGGASCRRWIGPVSLLGNSASVVIGAGGLGGLISGVNGAPGGTSTFTATIVISAPGGGGGSTGSATASAGGGGGGNAAGGTASGGTGGTGGGLQAEGGGGSGTTGGYQSNVIYYGAGGSGCSALGVPNFGGFTIGGPPGGASGRGYNAGVATSTGSLSKGAIVLAPNEFPVESLAGNGGNCFASANGIIGGAGTFGGGAGGGGAALTGFTPGSGGNGGNGYCMVVEW